MLMMPVSRRPLPGPCTPRMGSRRRDRSCLPYWALYGALGGRFASLAQDRLKGLSGRLWRRASAIQRRAEG